MSTLSNLKLEIFKTNNSEKSRFRFEIRPTASINRWRLSFKKPDSDSQIKKQANDMRKLENFSI